MRVSLNLATAASPRERYALVWAVPTALLALAGAVWLGSLGAHTYREFRQFRQAHAQQQAAESQLRAQETALRRELEQPAWREMYRQSGFVNSLIDQKAISVTGLTQIVSELMPPRVRLLGLTVSESGGNTVVRFSVLGENEEAMERFLGNLEDSPRFEEVAILSQGFDQEGEEGGAVTVVCAARYRGAPAP
jgi:hypothetical protein